MPYNIGGVRVRTRDEMREYYMAQHPDRVPKLPRKPKERQPENNYLMLVGLIVGFLAINTISVVHTVPMLIQFYPANHVSPFFLAVAGIAGSIAIEFMLVILMMSEKKNAVTKTAIFIIFITAMILNIMSAVIAVSEFKPEILTLATTEVFRILGVIVGAAAPVANLAVGETLSRFQIDYRRERREISDEFQAELDKREADYNTAVGEFELGLREAYARYLKRFIKTPDAAQTIELILSGDYYEDDFTEPVKVETPVEVEPEPVPEVTPPNF